MSTNLSQRELLRKKRLEQKRRKTTVGILVALGAVLLISLSIILPNLLRSRSRAVEGRGFTLGDPNAPVSVVNFSSYSCGFCEDFSETVEPEFIANYVDTGDVYYRYITLAFGSDAGTQNAVKASYCADDQNRFFDFKPYLFSAARIQNGFSTDNLVDLAANAGLEQAQFTACMGDNTHNSAPNEDLRFSQSVGVTGTPSFLVNNEQLVFSSELIPLVDSLLNR
ncbi:MAG: DsbA family protein [Brevefilum sp.]|nr:DsbA family protein [Brevefilum sp.]